MGSGVLAVDLMQWDGESSVWCATPPVAGSTQVPTETSQACVSLSPPHENTHTLHAYKEECKAKVNRPSSRLGTMWQPPPSTLPALPRQPSADCHAWGLPAVEVGRPCEHV